MTKVIGVFDFSYELLSNSVSAITTLRAGQYLTTKVGWEYECTGCSGKEGLINQRK